MKKIVLINQKGGCGKTTTAINVAHCLSLSNKKVLLLDLDPQGHAGLGLGVKTDLLGESIYEVLMGKVSITQAIHPLSDTLHAIFSNVVLSAFEQVMAGVPQRENILRQCLEEIEDQYDYVLIDSPPSVGLLTFNGLLAADEAIIPVDSSAFSINGLGKLLKTLLLIEQQTGHTVHFTVLPTNIDQRTTFGKSIVDSLRKRFPDNCFETFINTCTKLREAAEHGKAIADFDRLCAAYRDYLNVAHEIDGRPLQKPEKEVVFSIDAPDDAVVQLAGDFSDWEPIELAFNKKRGCLWQTSIHLKPGDYQYKYLINDCWIPDPANNDTIDNGFGSSNSIIKVSN